VLLVALLVVVFLVGLPVLLFTLARRGRTLRIASGLIAIAAGVGLGALVFVPAQSLPDAPLLGAAVELLLLATLPLSLLLMLLYPSALIGLGLFLLFRRANRNPHAAASSKQQ
jgi:hypothetical protein